MSRNNSCRSACLCNVDTQENYIRNAVEIFFNFSKQCIFINFPMVTFYKLPSVTHTKVRYYSVPAVFTQYIICSLEEKFPVFEDGRELC